MNRFKFIRGYVGTLNSIDGWTAVTASFFDPSTRWTPEESERIRIERMRISNDLRDEMLQVYQQNRIQEETRLPELEMNWERISQSIRQIEEQQLRLFQTTTTITVNPTLWTKIKIFGTNVKLVLKETWKSDPMGVIVMTCLVSVVTFIGIMKLFGA